MPDASTSPQPEQADVTPSEPISSNTNPASHDPEAAMWASGFGFSPSELFSFGQPTAKADTTK